MENVFGTFLISQNVFFICNFYEYFFLAFESKRIHFGLEICKDLSTFLSDENMIFKENFHSTISFQHSRVDEKIFIEKFQAKNPQKPLKINEFLKFQHSI